MPKNIKETGKSDRITQHACLTGTFYDTGNTLTNSYSVVKGYNPTLVGYVKIIVSMNGVIAEAITRDLNPDVGELSWTRM